MKVIGRHRRSSLYVAILFATVTLLAFDISGGHAEPWHAMLGIVFASIGCGLARLWLVRNANSTLAVHHVTLVAPYYPPEPVEYPERLSGN